jgi:hypothetical protein
MPFCFLCSPIQISCSPCFPDIATEQESGAKKSQLHFIAYVSPYLASGSSSALIPSLP